MPNAPPGYHGTTLYFYSRIVDICLGADLGPTPAHIKLHSASCQWSQRLVASYLPERGCLSGGPLSAGLIVVVGVDIFVLPW